MKKFIILRLCLKIRVINGLGKPTTLFDNVWYQFINMKNEVELAFESARFFKDVLLFFHLKQKPLNQKPSKILLQNLLVDDV